MLLMIFQILFRCFYIPDFYVNDISRYNIFTRQPFFRLFMTFFRYQICFLSLRNSMDLSLISWFRMISHDWTSHAVFLPNPESPTWLLAKDQITISQNGLVRLWLNNIILSHEIMLLILRWGIANTLGSNELSWKNRNFLTRCKLFQRFFAIQQFFSAQFWSQAGVIISNNHISQFTSWIIISKAKHINLIEAKDWLDSSPQY